MSVLTNDFAAKYIFRYTVRTYLKTSAYVNQKKIEIINMI